MTFFFFFLKMGFFQVPLPSAEADGLYFAEAPGAAILHA